MKMKEDDGNNSNIFNVDVNISDIILTPFACASIVNEVLKGVLYQKCQIPYPYNWMKSVITNKRQNISQITAGDRQNFRVENHFRLVSSVLDTVEAAMTSITNEFVGNKNDVKKVVIVLGTTPHTAKEVFTISLSSILEGHNERNHTAQLNKYRQKILRSIFLSQDWLDKIDASISCTNIFIYIIKKRICPDDNSLSESSVFLPSAALSFPKNTKHIKISLNSVTQLDTNCCESLMVFDDASENVETINNISSEAEQVENLSWYKYKDLVKGFKDCFVNKKSVSELW